MQFWNEEEEVKEIIKQGNGENRSQLRLPPQHCVVRVGESQVQKASRFWRSREKRASKGFTVDFGRDGSF
jgi:hypothetical protein